MSLILEALKKSEAERQLGKAPGLTTPMPMRSRDERRSLRVVLTLALLLVATASVAIWWYQTRRAAPASTSPSGVAVVERESAVEAARSGQIDASAGDRQTGRGARADPASSVAESTEVPARNATAVPIYEAPVPIPAPVAAPPPTSPELPRDPMFDSIEREARAMVASDARVPGASAPAGIEAPSNDASETRVAPVAGDAQTQLEQVVRFDQLPLDVRNALPPLKLSMHVYVDESGSRFVLIDGRRYAQGEAISDGLHVVEIRREGALLDFNGRRFLLARP